MKVRHKLEIVIMIVLLIISVISVSVFSSHHYDSNEVRVKNFFAEKENNIDVVHIGASEIYAGFSLEYIWNNYGITSYNLATSAAPLGLVKSQVKAVVKRQKPKLIVISLNGVMYGNKKSKNEAFIRLWIDNIPEGMLRNYAIDDLIETNQLTYRFKFLKYHSNIGNIDEAAEMTWKNLKSIFDKRFLTIRSVQGQATIDDRNLSEIINVKGYKKEKRLSYVAEKRLFDLLNYLKKEEITNVIFINMPRYYNSKMLWTKERINYAKRIVQEYGFDVYDFDDSVKDIGLDPKEDFYNIPHLNIRGQQKMSKYFYDNIVPNYNVNVIHTGEEVGRWNENYEIYLKLNEWIEHMIVNYSEQKIEYNYKVVDHIIDGTISQYEEELLKRKNK